jgi:hypothetical protein
MPYQPALDRRRLVGGGVVEHDVHVEVRGHGGIDQVEEAAELLRPMARRHFGEHLSGCDIERGVEVGGAVADVVVALPRRHPRHQRQHRRRTVERLDLRLLVHTEHDRRLGRVEIEPDDVSDLVDELRIRGQLERLRLVRLQPERPPDSADRALAHPTRGRHRTRRPMRRVRRLLLERLHEYPLDVGVRDRARLARPRLVMEPVKTPLREPAPPLAHGRAVAAQLGSDLRARPSLSRRQHDPAPKRQRLRALRPSSPPLEHLPLLLPEHDLRTLRHSRLPSSSLTRTTFATHRRVPAD